MNKNTSSFIIILAIIVNLALILVLFKSNNPLLNKEKDFEVTYQSIHDVFVEKRYGDAEFRDGGLVVSIGRGLTGVVFDEKANNVTFITYEPSNRLEDNQYLLHVVTNIWNLNHARRSTAVLDRDSDFMFSQRIWMTDGMTKEQLEDSINSYVSELRSFRAYLDELKEEFPR